MKPHHKIKDFATGTPDGKPPPEMLSERITRKPNRKSKFTTKDLVGSGSDGEATGERSRYFAKHDTTNLYTAERQKEKTNG